jgi:MoxR-like ATPase
VTAQTLTDTPTSEMDRYMPNSGRVVIRSGASARKKAEPVTAAIDAMTGDGVYLRPNGDKYFARKWGSHDDVEVIRKSRGRGHFVLLYGAPGCGKTAMVEAAFGDELETILGTGDTEVSDLVGGYVQTATGGFEWVDGPLIRAAETGRPLLIDEIGIIDPKVLTVVYGLMDGRREYTVTANPERGTVKAKDGFYVIAATNPNAPGVNLSEALLSRFGVHAEMTTDWSLAKKLGVPAQAVTAAQNLAKKRQSDEVSWAPQMRELLKFKDLAEDFGTAWAISNLLAAAPEMDRPIVADVFTRVYGEEARPAKI